LTITQVWINVKRKSTPTCDAHHKSAAWSKWLTEWVPLDEGVSSNKMCLA